jgi:uncharacterized membrane protein
VLAVVDALSVSVFIHVAAVVVGFGATFAEAIMFPVAMKLDVRHLPYVHQLGLAINRYLATPAMVLILITGFYQVSKGHFSFGDFWISGTFAIVLILGGLIGAYFVPEDRKLGAMVTRDIAAAAPGAEIVLSDEYQRRAKRIGIIGSVAGILVLAAIFLMVTKVGA